MTPSPLEEELESTGPFLLFEELVLNLSVISEGRLLDVNIVGHKKQRAHVILYISFGIYNK